ncbi:pyridoxal 5'-phosphate synthase glutaminase subunit PdxT [Methylotenera mobilis]|uniref:pyridoxal 5'-phosphate synthase glutaminase subunit PdxT n=1 Tax=Methylotenera mobilis TaxID=359408 RepID=UPI000380802A
MVGGEELKGQHGQRLKIGVLALQGAVVEHCRMLESLGVIVVEVRLPEHLKLLDGLIIPGGESTSMGLIAERWGLIEPLRSWVQSGRPTWGICAGMILLAERIEDQKQGGQPSIGGMDIEVNRNYFGRQINSFETMLNIDDFYESEKPYQAVFIRAPIITEVSDGVKILASLTNGLDGKLIVAARQKLMMVTAFHPELTDDLRWHQLFLNMVHESRAT